MRQLNEADAERLSPDQATDLVRVLDLQAEWENHRDDPTKSALSLHDLRIRQKAFEAFRIALRNYGVKYWNAHLPEMTQNLLDRLVIWCRVLRAVFLKANGGNPTHAMAKVYRLADRFASRLAIEPVRREIANDVGGAVRELDVVIAWCDSLALSGQSGKFNSVHQPTGFIDSVGNMAPTVGLPSV
jgi:hypothetical protein